MQIAQDDELIAKTRLFADYDQTSALESTLCVRVKSIYFGKHSH